MGSLDTEELLDARPPAFAGETCNHFFLVAIVALTGGVWVTFAWRELTNVLLNRFAQ